MAKKSTSKQTQDVLTDDTVKKISKPKEPSIKELIQNEGYTYYEPFVIATNENGDKLTFEYEKKLKCSSHGSYSYFVIYVAILKSGKKRYLNSFKIGKGDYRDILVSVGRVIRF